MYECGHLIRSALFHLVQGMCQCRMTSPNNSLFIFRHHFIYQELNVAIQQT